MSSPAEVSYDLNERVLCYHGPLIYEAKVLKPMLNYDETNAPTGIPGPHYFVHYKGWKQTCVCTSVLLLYATQLVYLASLAALILLGLCKLDGTNGYHRIGS